MMNMIPEIWAARYAEMVLNRQDSPMRRLVERERRTRKVVDVDYWGWTDGNWSCDCNRARYFGDEVDEEMSERLGWGICWRGKRFLVIEAEVEGKPLLPTELWRFNSDYGDDLLREHGIMPR